MRVAVHGDAYVGMTQPLGNHLRRNVPQQQHGCVCMPERVKRNASHAGRVAGFNEESMKVPGVNCRPEWGAEDQITVLPRWAKQQTCLILAHPVGTQQGHS